MVAAGEAMMRAWCNILPLSLIRRYAVQYGERFHVPGIGICVNPFGDVLIIVKKEVKS